jgi:hypothetical protein
LDSNQTSRQQFQVRHDMTADSPPMRGADSASNISPTLTPGSPNSHSSGNTGDFLSIPQYGRSYPPECACHRLAECPGVNHVESPSNGRNLDSSVSASTHWRTPF